MCGDVFGWDFRFYTEMVMFWVKDRKLWNWVLFCGNSKNGQIDKIWSLLSFLDLVLAVVFFRLIVNLIRYWIYYLNIVVIYEKILVFISGMYRGVWKTGVRLLCFRLLLLVVWYRRWITGRRRWRRRNRWLSFSKLWYRRLNGLRNRNWR